VNRRIPHTITGGTSRVAGAVVAGDGPRFPYSGHDACYLIGGHHPALVETVDDDGLLLHSRGQGAVVLAQIGQAAPDRGDLADDLG
jgi:hypothetical protein